MLEVRDLCQSYGGRHVLHHVSFSLAPGEVVAYLGPNGSGKTTTVKVLAGLLEPSFGCVLLDGRDTSEDPLAHRRRLGYVPEAAEVYSFLTGREYLLLTGRLRSLPESQLAGKVDLLLELFSLWSFRHEPLAAYSKGMRQKTLLCAALLHDPEFLVLDEPLTGLDATSVLVIKRLLARLAGMGRTILFSTHLLEVAERLCSRVVMIHQGRIVADDSVAALRQLMNRPSLEEIFAELTREESLDEAVEAILEVVTAPAG